MKRFLVALIGQCNRRRRNIVVLGLGVFFSLGFAAPAFAEKPMSEKVGERISRGVIEVSLETLEKPENRDRLGRILNSPQVRGALHDLTASIVLGVFDGVKQAQASGAIGKTEIAKAVGEGIERHVSPAVSKMTYRLVDSALTAAMADEHLAKMETLSESATHAVVRGLATGIEQELGPALAATLDKDLGPAIARLIERDVMPAVGRSLNDPEIQSAIRNATSSVANGFVYGTEQPQGNIHASAEDDGQTPLSIFGSQVALSYAIAQFVALAFGTILIVLTVVLIRSVRRQRRVSEDAKRREDALLHLLDSIESEHPELKMDTRRLLIDQLHSGDATGPTFR